MPNQPHAAYHFGGAWPQQVSSRPLPTATPTAAEVGDMLEHMTSELRSRIAEIELHHTEALVQMQDRLARLSGSAARAKPDMPDHLAAAFSRIEAGMADLVDRIAEAVPAQRRGGEGFVFKDGTGSDNHFVFDPPARRPVNPVTVQDDPTGEHWHHDAAEALTRLYESGEAELARVRREAAPDTAATRPAAAVKDARDADVAPIAAVPTATTYRGEPVVEQRWLEQQFATLGDQIADAVREARPNTALDQLMTQVDHFEHRFSEAVDGLVTKNDLAQWKPEALDLLQAQLSGLTQDLDHTKSQLARLDTIEAHLADLTAFAHASIEADSVEPLTADPHVADAELGRLVDLAVERMLAKLPHQAESNGPAGGNSDETLARVDAIRSLLERAADDRQRGEQTTSESLSMMQEALVRLIDRLDVIEQAALRPAVSASPMATASEAVPASAPAPAPAPAQASVAAATTEQAQSATVANSAGAAATAEAGSIRQVRRRERRSMVQSAPPTEAVPASSAAETAPTAPATPVTGRRGIRIEDLKLHVETAAGTEEANADQAGADTDAAAAPGRRTRSANAKAPAKSGSSRKGMLIGALALGLVGACVASLLFQESFGGQHAALPTGTATTALPAPAPGSASPVMPAAGTPTQAGAVTPPGMVGTPTPVAPQRAVRQAPNATPSPDKPAGQPGAANQDLQFTPTKPQSIPETGSDDLSQAEIPDPGKPLQPGRPAPAADATSPQLPSLVIAGLALAPSDSTAQVGEIASARRHFNIAAASEQAGARARPAQMYTDRFANSAGAQTAPITTGSTTDARDANGRQAVTELPPALVGPLSLRLAAAHGDPSAAFEVATRLAEGRGIKQDFKQALVWYQRAALKNFAVAEYRLASLYERGVGTSVDVARAREWYQKAAEQGNVKAMHNLAVLMAGDGKGASDYGAASRWFTAAAEHGLADSQFNLAVLYENGLGVAKDMGSAYVWYSLAARSGDAESTKRRDRLVNSLDVAQLKAANDQLGSWHAKSVDPMHNDARVAGDLWRNRTAEAQ